MPACYSRVKMLTSLLALALAAAPEPLYFTCLQLQRGVTVNLMPSVPVRLKLVLSGEHNGTLTTNLGRADQRVPLNCFDAYTTLKVQDFNFDGVPDLAVPQNEGYMGVNAYYTLLFTDPKAGKFVARLGEVSNPEPQYATRTLNTSEKDGPVYRVKTYCPLLNSPELYLCRSAEISQEVGDGDDWNFTWFDPAGKTLLSRPARVGTAYQPEIYAIATAKAFFYSAPTLSSRTAAYVVKNDKVELIELRGTWARVAFVARNKAVAAGWLPRSALK